MIKHTQVKKDAPNVVTLNMLRDSDVQLASTNVNIAISLVISVACPTGTRRESLRIKGLWSQEAHPKYINYTLVQFACKILYVASQMKVQVMTYSAYKLY